MKRILLLSFIALGCGPAMGQAKPAPANATTVAVTTGMKPGLWEINTVNESPGSSTKRSVTARNCFTAEDVGIVQRILPQQREFGMKCESRDPKAQGADVSWKVACAGKDGSMGGTGKMTVAAEQFHGSADLERRPTRAKPFKVTQTVSGKWISACK